ncbi:MAG: hypothetical protein ACI9TV_002863 [Sulfurimonas sp.]|jgi:hypothetical protein
MSVNTACPLDCYDACEITVDNGKQKGAKTGYTREFSCPHLNHYNYYETI